jgi:D-glycero-D-manno-heptose 1,7-bisphosphate phosphatase
VNRPALDRVVILDRDGTIVCNRHYLSDPAGLEFLPGAAEGLRALHEQSFGLIVITNQSGVGRGFFSFDQLQAMNARLMQMVEDIGARIERIYVCPHRPDENCACRKPGTLLLLQAATELKFDPARAVVIGDNPSDIEFGHRVGALTMLIAAQEPLDANPSSRPDHVVRNLQDAASILLALQLTAQRARVERCT